MQMAPVFCGKDCGGDACPLLAEVDRGRVLRIRHNPAAGEFIRACPKGFSLPEQHYSSKRILRPLLRTGQRGDGQYRETSWDEALAFVAERLSRCLADSGPRSVMSIASAGSTGALHNTQALTARFLNVLGGFVQLEGSYSSNAGSYALKRLFGGDYWHSGFYPRTIEDAGLVVLWGANVFEARLGSELQRRIAAAKKKGTKFIYIDPRRTSTAVAAGADWISIRPGTDPALMYALLWAWDSQGLIDESHIAETAKGFGELLRHVRGEDDGIAKTSSWAETLCGVGSGSIMELARRWISEKPTLLLPGYSIQRSAYGEEAARLCVALQLASGNFGMAGASTGSYNNRTPKPKVGRISTKDRATESLPIVRWADRIIDGVKGLQPRIRAVYSAGGNLVNQGSDIAKNLRAIDSVELAVCHDLFLTPTAALSDVILPVESPLQREDIGIPWDGNYLLYKPKILGPRGLERSDYDIFDELTERMGFGAGFSEGRSQSGWIREFIAESEIADAQAFMDSGIYFGEESARVGLQDFAQSPSLHPLKTESGKLEFGRGLRWKGLSPATTDRFPFMLITPKRKDLVHSQGGHAPKRIRENLLEMNADDADRLGLGSGDRARISSETGFSDARVVLSEDIRQGTVSLPEGSWLDLEGGFPGSTGTSNALTASEGTLESVSCIMHAVPVRVERLDT